MRAHNGGKCRTQNCTALTVTVTRGTCHKVLAQWRALYTAIGQIGRGYGVEQDNVGS